MFPWKRLILGAPLVALLVLSGCKQPTADPDQQYRDLIVSAHWITDEAKFPAEAPNFQILFNTNGTALIDGAHDATWSYKAGVFTLIYQYGVDPKTNAAILVTETTTSPDLLITANHFNFIYLKGLCHLIPLKS